jgi:hypothetical protein
MRSFSERSRHANLTGVLRDRPLEHVRLSHVIAPAQHSHTVALKLRVERIDQPSPSRRGRARRWATKRKKRQGAGGITSSAPAPPPIIPWLRLMQPPRRFLFMVSSPASRELRALAVASRRTHAAAFRILSGGALVAVVSRRCLEAYAQKSSQPSRPTIGAKAGNRARMAGHFLAKTCHVAPVSSTKKRCFLQLELTVVTREVLSSSQDRVPIV